MSAHSAMGRRWERDAASSRYGRWALGVSIGDVASSLNTIVCGVDDSPPACHAAQTAVHLAGAIGARLILVHVTGVGPSQAPVAAGGVSMPPSPLVRETLATARQVQDHACRWLTDFAEQIGAGGAEQLVAPFGDPARRLVEVAEREADLLVVGSNGRSAVRDVLLGSVSGRLAADAPAPVLIVPPGVRGSLVPTEWAGRRLVCGFDGSENASRAARFAAALAARVGADLHIACVLDGASESPSIDQPAQAELRAAAAAASREPDGRDCAITRELRRGDPADQLERVAAATTAPALVLGTRGRAPWRATLLGSVSRRVLDQARRPVILVPPAAVIAGDDGSSSAPA